MIHDLLGLQTGSVGELQPVTQLQCPLRGVIVRDEGLRHIRFYAASCPRLHQWFVDSGGQDQKRLLRCDGARYIKGLDFAVEADGEGPAFRGFAGLDGGRIVYGRSSSGNAAAARDERENATDSRNGSRGK